MKCLYDKVYREKWTKLYLTTGQQVTYPVGRNLWQPVREQVSVMIGWRIDVKGNKH